MPTGKRASMREGPLAALFRKTAEDVEHVEHRPEPAVPAATSSPVSKEPNDPPATHPPPEPR